VIVLTLALAIAANAMVFGIANLVLLQPLPLGNINRLVTLYGREQRQSGDRTRLSVPDYLDVKAQCTVCEDVLAMTRNQQMSLAGAGESMAVLGLVSICGALATYLPAHRAIAIDPMAVLKRE